MTTSTELLAPAGSFESIHAAINAKCDAVYFGIGDLNMRARGAKNFSIKDLPKIINICKKSNVRAYVTLNTIVYDQELPEMKKMIDAIKDAGADAIIASDMAVIQYARERGVEVHISTQLSISNSESLRFYAQFSDRVVLARELRLEQIKKISEQIKSQKITGPSGNLIELEAFVHGALCVAVSGRCNMSLYCHDESANRGKCLQMCRRQYRIIDLETKREMIVDNNFVMSPADLCTIGLLPELLDAGVRVLKIEGRAKSADYIDMVVRTYREALLSIGNKTYSQEKVQDWNKDLKTVYNKGQSQGLYRGRSFDEWSGIYGNKATKQKVLIGKIDKYYPKIKVAQINITHGVSFEKGEEYLIISDTTGAIRGKVPTMKCDEKDISKAGQGMEITFKVPKKIKKGDSLFILRKKK